MTLCRGGHTTSVPSGTERPTWRAQDVNSDRGTVNPDTEEHHGQVHPDRQQRSDLPERAADTEAHILGDPEVHLVGEPEVHIQLDTEAHGARFLEDADPADMVDETDTEAHRYYH